MSEHANAMVMTVLEAEVAEDRGEALEAAYRANTASGLPPGLVQSFLVRGAGAPASWCIVSVWESAGALARMRASGGTPTGVLMFRAAGAEPTLTVLDVLASPHS